MKLHRETPQMARRLTDEPSKGDTGAAMSRLSAGLNRAEPPALRLRFVVIRGGEGPKEWDDFDESALRGWLEEMAAVENSVKFIASSVDFLSPDASRNILSLKQRDKSQQFRELGLDVPRAKVGASKESLDGPRVVKYGNWQEDADHKYSDMTTTSLGLEIDTVIEKYGAPGEPLVIVVDNYAGADGSTLGKAIPDASGRDALVVMTSVMQRSQAAEVVLHITRARSSRRIAPLRGIRTADGDFFWQTRRPALSPKRARALGALCEAVGGQ